MPIFRNGEIVKSVGHHSKNKKFLAYQSWPKWSNTGGQNQNFVKWGSSFTAGFYS